MRNTYNAKCREGILMFASLVILIDILDLVVVDGVSNDDHRFS